MQPNIVRCLTLTTAALVMTAMPAAPSRAFWGGQCASTCQTGCDTCPQTHGVGSELYNYLETGRQANAMWPYPYVCPDRVRVVEPFNVMVNNGWRRQNLLGAHHFDGETGKLTRAGELKVQWILTQTPPNRRQIFVEKDINSETTDARIAAAQTFVDGIEVEGGEALVEATQVRSPSRPASMVDMERSSFIESRQPAVLPTGSSSTASSGN